MLMGTVTAFIDHVFAGCTWCPISVGISQSIRVFLSRYCGVWFSRCGFTCLSRRGRREKRDVRGGSIGLGAVHATRAVTRTVPHLVAAICHVGLG